VYPELEKYKIPERVFRYDGADHGFFCDRPSSYNPKTAADAWKQINNCLESKGTA
jgi:carboxymethylenebutenolidase